MAIFVVERGPGNGNARDEIEIEAARAEQAADSTRVTFYDANDNAVGSFINIQAWYQKPEEA